MANASPFALRACASFQIFTDICILGQFVIYRKNTKAASVSQKPNYEKIVQASDPPKVDMVYASINSDN